MKAKSKIMSHMVNLDDYVTIRLYSQSKSTFMELIENKTTKERFVAKFINNAEPVNSKNSIFKQAMNEVSVLLRIQVPTIIRFYGFALKDFKGNSNLAILMEYKEQGTLEQIIQYVSQALSLPGYDNTAKQIILCGIAHGMMTLHSRDIQHYDLRPENVNIDSNWSPCITNFGSFRKVDPLIETNSLQYFAPEVLQGNNFSKKSDVYSFGILMYEVLREDFAYSNIFWGRSKNPFDLISRVLNGERPRLDIPIQPSFKKLIEQCWSADPNKRPTFKQLFHKLSLSTDSNDDDDDELIDQQLLEVISNEKLVEDDENDYCLEDVDRKRLRDYVETITSSNGRDTDQPISDKQSTLIQNQSSQTKDESINLSKTNFPDIFVDLNNYTRIRQIGQGSFGNVHIIQEKSTSELYAIKISYTNLEIKNDVRSEMSKLNREIQTLTTFRHAAILRFIGFSPVDFNNELCPSIITEYHKQGSLRNFIQNEHHTLDPTQKLIILYGIASGMSFLHEHDYIHRDLKPENILLDSNLYPIIADFGLSKFINQNNDSTRSTVCVKGSPLYIAPEIFENENREYTKEGDVYAFSIIIYELITNSIPYESLTSSQIQEKILTGNLLTFPRQYQKSPFRQLFMNCQQTDASCRPTFSEIVQRLKERKFRDGINEEKFDKYIKSVEDYNEQFDPSNEKLKFSDFLKFQQRNQTSQNPIPFSSPRCWQMICDAAGNKEKLFQVGQNIYDGKEGFSRNREYGNSFIQKSADLGYLKAILLYAEHMEKEQKYAESASYYLKAAELGHPYGELKYGEILLEGRGIPQDKEKGLEYLSKSMKQGSSEAECLYQKYHNQ